MDVPQMEENKMAKYRKLSRTSDQRKALLRNQVTNLLYHGKIVTTEAKAKEIRKVAEKLIALAVKEKDNFETVINGLTFVAPISYAYDEQYKTYRVVKK